jgi:polysaccharide export outer membrane protein
MIKPTLTVDVRRASSYSIAWRMALSVLFALLLQHPAVAQTKHDLSAAAKGPATPAGSEAASSNDPSTSDFIIGNDDVLAINVWKEPDLTKSIHVRSDGKISLPLMGEIQAAGKTPQELEKDITVKLQEYISKPRVTVMIEQMNSKKFNILGQVVRPGSYSLSLAPTVVDAIAIAGGLRDFAKQKDIYVLRPNGTGNETKIAFNYKDFIKGKNLDRNVKLAPHDTVVVP